MKKNNFFTLMVTLIIMISIWGCKDKSATHDHIHPLPLSKDIPSEFLSFYAQFLADSTFQMDHIRFPLKMKKDGTHWLKEEWTMHRPLVNPVGNFAQEFNNLSSLIIETIADKEGVSSVERRFIKSDKGYELIYFSQVNAFENSPDWQSTEQ